MSASTSKSAPIETGQGEQKDDNIDDLGRRPDGKVQDQPVNADPSPRDRTGKDQTADRQ